MLTVKEVSEILKISEYKVRELISSNEIPSTKIGGSIRIPESFIKELEGDKYEELLIKYKKLKRRYDKLQALTNEIIKTSSKLMDLQ